MCVCVCVCQTVQYHMLLNGENYPIHLLYDILVELRETDELISYSQSLQRNCFRSGKTKDKNVYHGAIVCGCL